MRTTEKSPLSSAPPPPKNRVMINSTSNEDSGLCNDDNNIDREDNVMNEDDNNKLGRLTVMEHNDMKKTFANIDMTEKIKRFNRLSTADECVYGSGRCATTVN